MAAIEIKGARLAGIASAVPEQQSSFESEKEFFGEAEVLKISESTGVKSRYVAPDNMCTSDLCCRAAERLLDELGWSRDSVDALVFVTQTPDYVLPATSCSLHGRLGLPKRCAAFDVNLGCSGYVYGLWLASQFVATGSAQRVLLLVGDVATRPASPLDRSVALLFGDCGTATAIEGDNEASPMIFSLGTDGKGENHLIIPAGSFRTPHSEETARRAECDGGNIRSDEDVYMNGAEIFTFTLREVQPMVKAVVEAKNWDSDDVDGYVMHQANKFMLKHLAKRMKLPDDKVVLALEEYGNTSSASIPLAMTHALRERLQDGGMNLVLAGFGVGFSWGAVALRVESLAMPELILVGEDAIWNRNQECAVC